MTNRIILIPERCRQGATKQCFARALLLKHNEFTLYYINANISSFCIYFVHKNKFKNAYILWYNTGARYIQSSLFTQFPNTYSVISHTYRLLMAYIKHKIPFVGN